MAWPSFIGPSCLWWLWKLCNVSGILSLPALLGNHLLWLSFDLRTSTSQYCSRWSNDRGRLRYIWIGRPVRTHTKLICRKIKRVATDPRQNMKSSRRGTPTGVGIHFILWLFGKLILKIDENFRKNIFPHSWLRLAESCNTEVSGPSGVPPFRVKLILGSPAAVFLLENCVDQYLVNTRCR